MNADATIINLFWVTQSVLALAVVALVAAQFIFHWSIRLRIPSVYWPIATLAFSPKTNIRKVFRLVAE